MVFPNDYEMAAAIAYSSDFAIVSSGIDATYPFFLAACSQEYGT